LIRLAVRCRAQEAEVVLAELLELAPGGFEQVDAPDGLQDVVEYAIYGAEGELPELGAVEAVAGGEGIVEVDSREVPDDWDERWKRFYFPVLVGGRLYVRPPWEQPAQRGGVEEIVIDPGGAFGTGTHPTTRMCLELMLDVPAGGSFTDLGCGSGVLSIAAAKLGFDPVLGVDADRAAIEETDRNARANYVQIEARRLDLRAEPVPVADVMAANLTTRLCEGVAARWCERGERPGTLVASGFLREEADRLVGALGKAGLSERRRVVSGDWAALLVQ
jgi:ribosomal protein L11 methyltransferase